MLSLDIQKQAGCPYMPPPLLLSLPPPNSSYCPISTYHTHRRRCRAEKNAISGAVSGGVAKPVLGGGECGMGGRGDLGEGGVEQGRQRDFCEAKQNKLFQRKRRPMRREYGVLWVPFGSFHAWCDSQVAATRHSSAFL